MPKGIYKRKPRAGVCIREVATCRACGWAWKPTSGFTVEPCPHCGKEKNVRVIRQDARSGLQKLIAWRSGRAGVGDDTKRRYRKTALLLIGKGRIVCCRCACDRAELIEINHKNGGGMKELQGKSTAFYRNIALLRRPIDDLDLRCKPCNAVHALELLYGPLPFKVVWGQE